MSSWDSTKNAETHQQQKNVVMQVETSIQHSSPGRSKRRGSTSSDGKNMSLVDRIEKCFPKTEPLELKPCQPSKFWDHGIYQKDSCASGIMPMVHDYKENRRIWCKTPLSTYQSSIGELGRKILCREPDSIVPRDIRSEPPCNICHNVLPPCRGYYRKYECIRPCEEEYVTVIGNRRIYRDSVTRYWDPCTSVDKPDVNELAPHNVVLAKKLYRDREFKDCW